MSNLKIVWSRSGRKEGKIIGNTKRYCNKCKKLHNFYVVEWEHKITTNCPNIMIPYKNGLRII